MPSTARDLIQDALETLGEMGVGEPMSAEDAAYGLLRLNQLLDSWSTRRLFVYTINIASYPLIASNPDYQIGPGGVFVAARPLRIDAARILLLTGGHYVGVKDLDMLTQAEYVELSDKQATALIPEKLYNDGSYPNSTLSLYPAPTCAVPSKLELSTWTALPQFATLLTAFSFPPGYYSALLWSLVVELGPAYNKPPNEAQAAKALEAMAAIQNLNRLTGMADMATQPANPQQAAAGQAGPA